MGNHGELVLLERNDGWARITLNRADKRNAMNLAAQAELRAALEDCLTDCRALIITGSGEAFCSGIDLKEQRQRQASGAAPPDRAYGTDSWAETNCMIRTHPAVCIAVVNGYALGGGITLINACDLAIAAHDAEIGMPEMGFATYPGLAGPTTQLRVLPKHAAWLVFTARRIDGREAERIGLINKSVNREELQAEGEALARHIAQFDPTALSWSKRALATVPFQISNWSDAVTFGRLTNSMIRSQTSSAHQALDRFVQGQKNVGQGR